MGRHAILYLLLTSNLLAPSTFSQDLRKKQAQELELATDVNTKISAHLNLSKSQLHRDAQASLDHLKSARNLMSFDVADSSKFNIYAGFVNYHFIRQDYKSVTTYIDSTSLYRKQANPEAQIRVLARLAQSSFFLNDFKKSVEAYEMALAVCEEHQLLRAKVGVLNQISSVYRKHGNLDEAERFVREALALNANSNYGDIMYSKALLGKIKVEKGEELEALDLLREVYDYTQEHRDPVLLHSVNSYLSELYFNNNDLKKSLKHSRENLAINTQIKNEIGILGSKTQIASIFTKQGKYDSAVIYIKKFIPDAERINSTSYLEQSYRLLSENYEFKGEFIEALKYRKLYEKWNDSLLNSEHLEAVSELRIKYETEKKENDILLLSAQSLKDEVALQKQNTQIKQLTFGLIAGILLFGGIFIIYRQHFRNKKQRDLLMAITETQTQEGIRIAKDLHDSVGGTLALTKNRLEQILEANIEKEEEVAPFLDLLAKTGDQIREISHNMMPGELLKFGLISALQSLLDHAKTENFDTHFYHHGFKRRLDAVFELNLYRVCQEALQNTLKHAEAQNFTLNLNRHDTFISLMIEDDGCGIPEGNRGQKGMGLKNIENRVALFNGKMKITSVVNKGTTFDIKFATE